VAVTSSRLTFFLTLKARGVALTGLLLLAILISACVEALGGAEPEALSLERERPADVDAVRLTDVPDAVLEATEGVFTIDAIFSLVSPDPSFGGLSGLWLDPDGETMIAVSDRGQSWKASFTHDGEGRLIGIDDWSVIDLRMMRDGRPARASYFDAEALTGDADQGIVVSYEGIHRLRRWPSADMRALPQRLPLPAGLGQYGNSGIEALATLANGKLFGIAERSGAPGNQGLQAWIMDEYGAEALVYAPAPGFSPTGADRLEDVIYLVERSFSLLGGFRNRIVTLPAEAVEPGASIEGTALAQFRWGPLGENFEAIAARRGQDGRVILYLLADDNFSFLQKNLLVQLSMASKTNTN